MEKKYPFYIKCTMILFGLVLAAFILSVLEGILIPLSLAILISMLLNPLVNKLGKWGVPHLLSIFIAIFIGIIVFLGITYFLSSQIISFGDDLPELKKKFAQLSDYLHKALHDKFGISEKQQDKWMTEAQADIKPVIGKLMGSALGSIGIIILLPVYTFLLLFYKKLILNFFFEIFEESKAGGISDVIQKIKAAVQNYMFGLVIEGLIVCSLNTIALLILGVKYAILLGVISAIVNVLPFIGGILAIIFPVVIATITKDGFQTQLLVIASFTCIQFLDNHVLIPFIVSSKVKINALLSIIVVLLGGALWGIAGMFLAIPFVGVLKIIFDRIEELKPYGKLLGDEIPVLHKGHVLKLKKIISKK